MNIRTSSPIQILIFGGLAGWAAHLALIYLLAPLAGLEMGALASFVGAPAGDGTTGVWIGRLLLVGAATVLALPYRALAEYFTMPAWESGITYGLAVWLISGVIIFPLLGSLWLALAPGAFPNPGILGTALAGTPGMVISAAGHALYGLVLALIYHAAVQVRDPHPI